MKPWQILMYGVIIGLVASGLILLVLAQPHGEPVVLRPIPTHSPIAVHVSGAVNRPGVYSFSEASRVEQAIEAAGGFSSEAIRDAVNLAAPIQDGQRIWVPALGEYSPGNETKTLPKAQASSTPTTVVSFPVNINTASLDELDQLPGIGQQKAGAILAYRQTHGAYTSIEEIQNVPGIGEGIFSQIKELITVDSGMPSP